ncbi:two-component system chemotaxis response regulator CheB [Salsuginibacillus halophilus]|uniref:Protein-glutamate methylesterase/protein-glutamine glutaminase n=1 Tax=Salsuginibacillus halophilus TaxID=517424 RepID=A0A2P8HYB6_9BACI|nr:two-component system chemotaxis response regulator CheB [Salsuginibacillus halophilus]
MIQVLVVDDSAFMRKLISDFIAQAPDMEVSATARNGEDALKKAADTQFDVMTLDVEMPVMDGFETLQQVMTKQPLPVVMLSSTTLEGTHHTIRALEYGAVDVVAKPSGSISLDLAKVKDELIHKIRAASVSRISKKTAKPEVVPPPAPKPESLGSAQPSFVTISTSTGGPRALQTVLKGLPGSLEAPIVIVQHMPPRFTKSLAERLDTLTELTVKEAEDGEPAQKGTAYIVPGDRHITFTEQGGNVILKLTKDAPVGGHRPSADYMLEGASLLTSYQHTSVVMTGMGYDGSRGLQKLKERCKCYVIAEHPSTAVVYGMPKAAVERVGADEQLPVEHIAASIVQAVSQSRH